jgi:hypothetical protein
MQARRPAPRVLARASLAAAGAAAPLATIAALLAGPAWIVLAVSAWGALVAFAVRAPQLWPGMSGLAARRALAVAWALALIAFVFGLVGHYAIAIDHSLCGGGTGATSVAAAVATGVYLAAGVWALRTGGRAVWAWPVAVLLGWGVHLLLLFALPGAHGFCET